MQGSGRRPSLQVVIGVTVTLIWATLHVLDYVSEPFSVPNSVDLTMGAVVAWFSLDGARRLRSGNGESE